MGDLLERHGPIAIKLNRPIIHINIGKRLTWPGPIWLVGVFIDVIKRDSIPVQVLADEVYLMPGRENDDGPTRFTQRSQGFLNPVYRLAKMFRT